MNNIDMLVALYFFHIAFSLNDNLSVVSYVYYKIPALRTQVRTFKGVVNSNKAEI